MSEILSAKVRALPYFESLLDFICVAKISGSVVPSSPFLPLDRNRKLRITVVLAGRPSNAQNESVPRQTLAPAQKERQEGSRRPH